MQDRYSNSTKLKSFLDKGLFIDCKFYDADGFICQCHRIVVSLKSKFFARFFCSNKEINVIIPFDTKNRTFSLMIDMMYLDLVKIPFKNTIELYFLSIIYEIDDLNKILFPQMYHNLSVSQSVAFLEVFSGFRVHPLASSIYMQFDNNFNNLLDSFDPVLDFLGRHYSEYKIASMVSYLCPKFLYKILIVANITQDDKIAAIDFLYNEKKIFSESSRSDFSSLFDWNDEKSCSLFVNHSCEWVLPSNSREILGRILDNRRNTLHQMGDDTSGKDFFNNMFLYSWLSLIHESKGDRELPIVDLNDYVSTLGGYIDRINPTKFNILSMISSSTLTFHSFGIENLFFNENKYFLASSFNQDGEPLWISSNIQSSVIELYSITPEFNSIPRGVYNTDGVRRVYDDIGYFNLELIDEDHNINEINEVIELNRTASMTNPIRIRGYRLTTKGDINDIRYVRLNRIKIMARFVC